MELSELLLKATLDPGTYFTLVEGPWDRHVLKHCLADVGDVFAIREVELIRLPEHIASGPDGNKGRLKRLASFIDHAQGPTNIAHIVDRDFDFILGEELALDSVYYTDFSCMEAYGATLTDLQAALRFAFGVPAETDVVASILNWARWMFLLYAAKRAAGVERKMPDFKKYMKPTGEFHGDAYLAALRPAGFSSEEHAKVVEHHGSLLESEGADCRMYIHFESFCEAISFVCRKNWARTKTSPELVEAVLKSNLQVCNVGDHPLFKQIRAMAKAA